jgi:hypothetical protein
MKKLLMLLLGCLGIITLMQAQIGKVGINTTVPAAMLHVKDSSVLFTGANPLPVIPGAPSASGAGTRMMWYPNKAAFRVGNVSGPQWNKDSIGLYSIAFGQNTRAKGSTSTAMGFSTVANGNQSTAMGFNTVANGNQSTAMGYGSFASGEKSTAMGEGTVASGIQATALGLETTASGPKSTAMGELTTASEFASTAMGYGTIANGAYSTAMGFNSKASGSGATSVGFATIASGDASLALGVSSKAIGNESVAMGIETKAKPLASVVLGQYNDTSSISSFIWNVLDPVFIIGNGTANNARANAMTVLKNGKTGINTTTPDAMLHVIKDVPTNGPYNINAAAIFEGDQGSFIQLSNDNTIQSGILSGNEVTAIRSALIFAADSSINLRTGGNVTKATLSNTGNLGIGTTSPQKRLHVSNGSSGVTAVSTATAVFEDDATLVINLLTPDANSSAIQFGNNSSPVAGGIIYNHSSVPNGLLFRTNGNSTKMVISDIGNVGVGTTTPGFLLEVNGTVGKPGGGSWSNSSDIRLKKDVKPYAEGLATLMQIKPVTYRYNELSGYDTRPAYVGVIAQQLQEIAPYMVSVSDRKTDDGVKDYLQVDNSPMTYMLINAVKEQQNIIMAQQTKLDIQQTKLDALEKEMDELKSMVQLISSKRKMLKDCWWQSGQS